MEEVLDLLVVGASDERLRDREPHEPVVERECGGEAAKSVELEQPPVELAPKTFSDPAVCLVQSMIVARPVKDRLESPVVVV